MFHLMFEIIKHINIKINPCLVSQEDPSDLFYRKSDLLARKFFMLFLIDITQK